MSEPQVDAETMAALVHSVIFSADRVAMQAYRTEADRTRAIVQRTLEVAAKNGLIEIKPQSEWPDWIELD